MKHKCKYCDQRLESNIEEHDCPKKGLLNVHEDDSFLVSAIIGYATDSALLGGVLGGDLLGSITGDILGGGGLFD